MSEEGTKLSEDPAVIDLVQRKVLEDDIYAIIIALVVCCICYLPFSYIGGAGVKELEKQNKGTYKYTKIDRLIYNYSVVVALYSFFYVIGILIGFKKCAQLSTVFVFICNIIAAAIMSQLHSAKGGFRLFLRILSGFLSLGTGLFKGSPMGDFRYYWFKRFTEYRYNVSWPSDQC